MRFFRTLVGLTPAGRRREAGASSGRASEHTLFTDMEILGTLGMLLFPLVFGIVMPLTE